jgi:type III secretion system FlhB-like substrate exporter
MEKALAIKYNKTLPAPLIIAKGKGELAKIIKKIAKEYSIFIKQDINLADNLIELDVGTLIPEKYYEIMAQILAFVKMIESI